MVALVLLFVLLSGFLTPDATAARRSRTTSAADARSAGQTATPVLDARRRAARHARVPLRDDPADAALPAAPRHRDRRRSCRGPRCMGLVFGIVGEGLAVGDRRRRCSLRAASSGSSTGGDLAQLALGGVAVTALWAVLGVAIGAIVRHQVGAIVGVLAYLFVVENLLFGLVPKVGRYLPGPAGEALVGSGSDHLLLACRGRCAARRLRRRVLRRRRRLDAAARRRVASPPRCAPGWRQRSTRTARVEIVD